MNGRRGGGLWMVMGLVGASLGLQGLTACNHWRGPVSSLSSPLPPPTVAATELSAEQESVEQEKSGLVEASGGMEELWSGEEKIRLAYFHILAGQWSSLEGRASYALRHYKDSYDLYPNASTGARWMVSRLRGGEEIKNALQEVRKMVLLYPQSSELKALYGKVLLAYERKDEAIIQFKEAIKRSPATEEAFFQLIQILWAQRQLHEAQDYAEQYTRTYPRSWRAWALYAQVMFSQKDYERAYQASFRALRKNPHHYPLMLMYAQCLAKLGKTDEVIAQYRKLHRRVGQDVEFQYSMEGYALLLGLDDAFSTLQDLIADLEDAKYIPLEKEKIRIYLFQQKLTEVEGLVQSLEQRFPEDDEVIYVKGVVAALMGRNEQALEAFAQVPKHSPLRAMALMQGVDLARQEGDHERGVALVEQLLALKPLRKAYLYHGVLFYRSLEYYETALAVSALARRVFPLERRFVLLQGHIYYDLGWHDRLVELLSGLIAANAKDHEARNFLGYYYAERGEQLQQALQWIQEALVLSPQNAAYLDSLGWVYFQMGDIENARKYIFQAADMTPNDGVVLEHVAEVLLKIGECERAREILQRALAVGTLEKRDRKRIQKRREKLELELEVECGPKQDS